MTAQSDLGKLKIWLHSNAGEILENFIEKSDNESIVDFIQKLGDHRIMEHEKILFPIFRRNRKFLELYVKLFKPNCLQELMETKLTGDCCVDCLRIYKPKLAV